MSFESWVDKQVREAAERGELDDLPGAGKPLPGLHRPLEEHWWLKEYARRENLSTEAMLPPALRLRKEIERLPEQVRALASEQAVRDTVAELNRRIAERMREPAELQVPLAPVRADEVVQRWRSDREAAREAAAPAPPAQAPEPLTRRRRWWRRRGHEPEAR